MKLSIGKKLMMGFLGVLILLIIVSTVSIWSMSRMGNEARNIQNEWMPSVQILNNTQRDIIDIQRLVLQIILETDGNELNKVILEQQQVIQDLNQKQKQYEDSMLSDSTERNLYQRFKQDKINYFSQLSALINHGQTTDLESKQKLLKQVAPIYKQTLNDLEKNIQYNTSQADQATSASVQLYTYGWITILAASSIAIVFGIGIALFMARIISKPMTEMVKMTERIASGDLTGNELKVKNRDEIGMLAKAFNEMSMNLRKVIQQAHWSALQVVASSEELLASSEQTSKATEHIASSIQEISAGSQQQVSNIEQSAQTINEMASGIQQIAGNAETVSLTVTFASEATVEGNQAIDKAINQMNAIHTTVQDASYFIKELGTHAQNIGKIVGIITEIASQTNLLALNAAIEAARAGEHGRGFAVVADEVRKLAEQSSNSAKQITNYIHTIQEGIAKAVAAMDAGTKEANAGIEVVNLAKDSFDKISASVDDVFRQIQEVSAATEQMSVGAQEIVRVVDDIAEGSESIASASQTISATTQEQLASMEEIATAASGLAKMTEDLQLMIHTFKV
ncbi:methyl-accepting chemotaxis protein [Fodinisporobacter ferrooxydans]|uniref:Methyl-accepting chemotaxis protein n=1 Tax=Fodinisporobacter ferrooxydans TaxID=2901836 RepID=A0ABY4CLV7_9BACL|nr:methyl-accepting chemotaxis protein [Alicyclobacillaceae bacterium MYW30-H2]